MPPGSLAVPYRNNVPHIHGDRKRSYSLMMMMMMMMIQANLGVSSPPYAVSKQWCVPNKDWRWLVVFC